MTLPCLEPISPLGFSVLFCGDCGVNQVHYRNGREAKNGDEIVQLETGSAKITGAGVLIRAVPGNDYCNGIMANDQSKSFVGACLCDCLHVDDVAELLAEKGLEKRPAGK